MEITARWQGTLAADTRLSVNAGYGWFDTKLDVLRANPALPTLPLLGTRSLLIVTEGQPRNKATFQANLTHGRFDIGANVAAFGTYRSAPLIAAQQFDGKTTIDAQASYAILPGVRLGAGVQNLLDVRPDRIIDPTGLGIPSTGGSFPAAMAAGCRGARGGEISRRRGIGAPGGPATQD